MVAGPALMRWALGSEVSRCCAGPLDRIVMKAVQASQPSSIAKTIIPIIRSMTPQGVLRAAMPVPGTIARHLPNCNASRSIP